MSSNIFTTIMISSNFIFNFTNICFKVSFFSELLTLGILFLTAVRAAIVAKLVILGILFLTSFILPLGAVVVAKLAIVRISSLTSFLASRVVLAATLVLSGILSSIFFILELYTSFLATSCFTT